MDTDELQGMMVEALKSLADLGATQHRFDDAVTREVERLWKDNGALRDDLHALANRIEALTNARPTVTLPFVENEQECPDCGGTGEGSHPAHACARCQGFGKVRYAAS